MKAGSCFTGIGGFDIALIQAGFEIAWQCENDEQASALLARRFPGIKNFGDINRVKAKKLGSVDLICGGFPCQDLSVAGKREGLAGKRSGLYFRFAELADELGARWFVGENVPGLLSSNEGKDFALVIGGLTGIVPEVPADGWKSAGVAWGYPDRYCVAWRVLDSQYFGLAQRRKRVFIVGSLGNGRCAEVLFESEGVCWYPPTRRQAGERVAASLTRGSAAGGGNEPGRRREDDVNLVAGTLPAHSKKHGHAMTTQQAAESDQIIVQESFTMRGGKGHGGKGYLGGGDRSFALSEQEQYVSATLQDSGAGTSRPAGMGSEPDFLVAHPLASEGSDASEDGTGRGTPIVVAGSLSASDGGVDMEDAMAGNVVAGAVSSKWAKGTGGPSGDEAYNLTVVPLHEVDSRGSANGMGIGEEDDPMFTLEASQINGVAFQQNTRDEVRLMAGDGGIAGAVAAEPGAKQQNYVAFTERTRKEGVTFEMQEDVSYALTNPGAGGRSHSRNLAGPVGVRRLTPTECERLQGFPDGWTEGQSDSARYRQLGNAVSIPPVFWIMQRIARVDGQYPAPVA